MLSACPAVWHEMIDLLFSHLRITGIQTFPFGQLMLDLLFWSSDRTRTDGLVTVMTWKCPYLAVMNEIFKKSSSLLLRFARISLTLDVFHVFLH